MFGIGGGELIFIIFIALMLFGTDKLPEAVRTFAKIMTNLKHATNEIKSEIQKSADIEGINSSIKQITTSITQEVEKVKENVSVSNVDLGDNILKEATETTNIIKEDFEDITGPIKRQL